MRADQYFYLFLGMSLFGSIFLWPQHPVQGAFVIVFALGAFVSALRRLRVIFGDEDYDSSSWVTWIIYAIGSFALFAWFLAQFFSRNVTILLN